MPATGPQGLDYSIDPDTGCWLWLKSLRKGYGRKKVAGKDVPAHRWYYEQKYGPIPEGLVIDHRVCETPQCVNPDHMEPVTVAVNTQRGTTGKLTNSQVDDIRQRYDAGEKQKHIASDYGIHQSQVSRIVNDLRWRQV